MVTEIIVAARVNQGLLIAADAFPSSKWGSLGISDHWLLKSALLRAAKQNILAI